MKLRELIETLEKYPVEHAVPLGFGDPDSYRGYYDQIAFRVVRDTTVGAMLKDARSADGETYYGYKGGNYTMGLDTDVWLAEYGHCGEEIGPVLLGLMLSPPLPRPSETRIGI